MAHVSTYLNLPGTTEEAFNFYKNVFRTEIMGIMRHGDVPGADPNSEHANLVMNIALPILNGHILMGTDVWDEMLGQPFVMGNSFSIALHPDSKEEADRLYNELSAGGNQVEPMQDMFWGDYWGYFIDKFGVHWMINYSTQSHV